MFRYRLLTLIAIVSIAAVVFAVLPRDGAITKELRHDLKIAAQHRVWILDREETDRTLAVVKDGETYKLFVCYRNIWGDGSGDTWEIPFVVGSGAPPGEPEAVWEHSIEFDHYPTDKEISLFRERYGL